MTQVVTLAHLLMIASYCRRYTRLDQDEELEWEFLPDALYRLL